MKKRILIIDDSKDIRMLLSMRLHDIGFSVMEAENGREGIEKAKERLPDLIITDYSMPEMDGLKAARILKADQETKNIPIILLSSFPFGKDMIEQIKSIGIDIYMIKPYEFDLLHKKITELLIRKEKVLVDTPSGEKRKFFRYPVTSTARVQTGGTHYIARLLNVSREGFSMILPQKENIGIQLSISFDPSPESDIDPNSEHAYGRATLVWIYQNNQHEYIAGFEMQSSSRLAS
ncbi:MAG: response regulator [Candidatus Aureabacteria bacterium]|nr:response regulator [Candidatus Auribacterota bacterium]